MATQGICDCVMVQACPTIEYVAVHAAGNAKFLWQTRSKRFAAGDVTISMRQESEWEFLRIVFIFFVSSFR